MQHQIYTSLMSLLGIVFTGIVGIASRAVLHYLKTHQKMKWAQAAVKFVEETYKSFNGQEKFSKATDWLSNQLQSVGIKNVSSTELQGLIQSAVLDMRNEAKVVNSQMSNNKGDSTTTGTSATTQGQNSSPTSNSQNSSTPSTLGNMTETELVQLISKTIQESNQQKSPNHHQQQTNTNQKKPNNNSTNSQSNT